MGRAQTLPLSTVFFPPVVSGLPHFGSQKSSILQWTSASDIFWVLHESRETIAGLSLRGGLAAFWEKANAPFREWRSCLGRGT